MNIRLIAKADFTKTAYLPFETASRDSNPRSLAEIAEAKDQVDFSNNINTSLEHYQNVVSELSQLDQKTSDLNRLPGEVAVSGAKLEGFQPSYDAYFKFQPSHTGQEQPVVSAELAENGKTVFAFRQESWGAETKLTATVVDRVSGQEYKIAGSLNGMAKFTTAPKEERSQSASGGDWIFGSYGTSSP